MKIVGQPPRREAARDVHTIDIWFDPTRRAWVVERLNAAGDALGMMHVAKTRREALDCAAHWQRQHGETYLVALTQGRAR